MKHAVFILMTLYSWCAFGVIGNIGLSNEMDSICWPQAVAENNGTTLGAAVMSSYTQCMYQKLHEHMVSLTPQDQTKIRASLNQMWSSLGTDPTGEKDKEKVRNLFGELNNQYPPNVQSAQLVSPSAAGQ